jgi:predicted phosphoadenosine phosphosulfate sulfurtransferase
MSSAYWQTKRRQEQFGNGKTLTSKVEAYVETWERRCYSGGIPDILHKKIEASGRAPSWRAIAIALLKNDSSFQSLGFQSKETKLSEDVYLMYQTSKSKQMVFNFFISEAK